MSSDLITSGPERHTAYGAPKEPHSRAGLITYNFHPPFGICKNVFLYNNHPSIMFTCDWATRTTTLSYSHVSVVSTQTLLLVVPRFDTVTN